MKRTEHLNKVCCRGTACCAQIGSRPNLRLVGVTRAQHTVPLRTRFRHKSRGLPLILIAALAASTCSAAPAPKTPVNKDIIIADFEDATYRDWTARGTAFELGPARGARAAQLGIGGVRGHGAASSEMADDAPQGTLISPGFKIQERYISFVIGGGKYERDTCLNLIVGGQIVRSATGNNSDFLRPASWDVTKWRGQKAQLQIVDNASTDWGHINVDHILQTDQPERMPVTTQPLYQETFRPQFHFTARQWTIDKLNPGQREEGWLNDLNGLVYYAGEYHLFAQRWNKCWIHAVSRDLMHWTELEPAFWEESLNSGTQSGNCVIDYGNSSGLSPDKNHPPMVAFWSRADNRSHCISYSLDHGRSWKMYAKNPILVFPERDPMVFWHEPTKRWVMVMYGNDQYHIFTSPNLLDWQDEKNPIANSFECPDMFQLPLDGDAARMKWVLIRGNGKYSVGDFDGTKFHEETPQLASDGGPNFYATQSWGNTPDSNTRRIQAAWMRGGTYPEMPFNQQITFPRELTLRSTPDGLRLFREPIREIASLHKSQTSWNQLTLQPNQELDLKPTGDLFHLKMKVNIPENATLTLNIRGVPLVLNHQSIACQSEPQTVRGNLKTVEVLIDRTSIEAFANGGEVSTSTCFLPAGNELSLKASGGAVTIDSLQLFRLNSIWK